MPVEAVDDASSNVGASLTRHRHSPKCKEQILEREEEPGVFHQEPGFHSHRVNSQLAHDEVPVAGVRCNANHALLEGRNIHNELPPMVLHYAASNFSQDYSV